MGIPHMHPVRDPIQQVSFSIREISDRAAELDDVVRLDIGQPDFATPTAVTDKIGDVLADQAVTYTSLWGIPELREQIAAFESHKSTLSADNVMVTTGGTGALYCILNALLDTGDTVVMNDPAWSPYQMITAATPGTHRQVPYIADDGTVRDDAIRDTIDDRTAAMIINTPENPTGRVYTREQIQQLCDIAADEDLYIIADEVYDQLLYGADHYSPAQYMPDRTLVVNSVSKNFAMTGWRLGWVSAQDTDLIHELGKVNRGTTACPNFPAQQAALIALQEAQDYAATMRDTYHDRRDLVMDRIHDLGWDCVEPEGAIYAFPNTGQDSWDFALDLLDDAGVAVVPGANCGTHSDTNIRICFGSADTEQLEEGFDRIDAVVNG